MTGVIAIDVGNTSTKFAFFGDGELLASARLPTEADRSADVYAKEWEGMCPGRPVWSGGAIASVVRGVPDLLDRAVEKVWGFSLHRLDPNLDLGLTVGVPDPNAVGIDRLLAAAEGYRIVEGGVVVAGLGSALTVDLVTATGTFAGGAIAPGLGTALWSLSERADLLPLAPLKPPASALGRNTTECIQAGIVYGMSAAVDRLFTELGDQTTPLPSLILSGGDAALLSPFVVSPHRVEADLVVRGVYWTYVRNFG